MERLETGLLWWMRRFPVHRIREQFARFIDFDRRLRNGEHEIMFTNPFGIRFQLDVRESISRKIFLYGWYESNCVRWLRRVVRPGMVFIDIGANLGQYTLLASALVGPKGSVHAFEPEPDNFHTLSRNIEANPQLAPNITLNAVGLGSREETLPIYTPNAENLGCASVACKPTDVFRSAIVQITTLDRYVEARSIRAIDFLKLDIEGYELKALQGAEHTLRTHRPRGILCEFNPLTLEEAGTSPSELFQFILKFGYRAFLPRGFPLPLVPIRKSPPDRMVNILFLQPEV